MKQRGTLCKPVLFGTLTAMCLNAGLISWPAFGSPEPKSQSHGDAGMESTMPQCLKVILHASEFADQVLGKGPELSPSYLAYREAMGLLPPAKPEQLEYIVKNGTPDGRLYASVILSQNKVLSSSQSYSRLLDDKAGVTYQSGCKGISVTVSMIAQSLLETGKYLNFEPLVPFQCTIRPPDKIDPISPDSTAAKEALILSKLQALVTHKWSRQEQPSAQWKSLEPRDNGKNFLDKFPLEHIKGIDLLGDDVWLPTSLVLHCIATGKLTNVGNEVANATMRSAQLTLTNGDRVALSIQFAPLYDKSLRVGTSVGPMAVPDVPHAKAVMSLLHVGMTRKDLQKHFGIDGGLLVPFKYERMVFEPSRQDHTSAQVTKVNLSFRPAGMSEVTYRLGKWVSPKEIRAMYLKTSLHRIQRLPTSIKADSDST